MELSSRYRHILKKCLLLNAFALGLFVATNVQAASFNPSETVETNLTNFHMAITGAGTYTTTLTTAEGKRTYNIDAAFAAEHPQYTREALVQLLGSSSNSATDYLATSTAVGDFIDLTGDVLSQKTFGVDLATGEAGVADAYNGTNYIKNAETMAEADRILDNKIGSLQNGKYIDSDSTVANNLVALDDQLKLNTDTIGVMGSGNYVQATESIAFNIGKLDSEIANNAADITENAADIVTNANNIATNTTNIAENTADITANANNIATNTANIATNTADIAENAADIVTNTNNIAVNTNNIATNTADIAENAADIVTNTNNIAVNTNNIATNTADIATNTTNIAENTADIATNAAAIATNTADIATNAAGIATNTAAIATKANAADVYTKTEAEAIFNQKQQWVDETLGIVSANEDAVKTALTGSVAGEETTLTGAINALDAAIETNAADIATKANAADVYTKTEAEAIFNQKQQWVDETLGIVSANEDAVKTALTGSVAGEETTLTGAINALDAAIETNAENILINAIDIATNADNIATNADSIATNKDNIATNANNIATNKDNIATNADNIATNADNIQANANKIVTNATNIAANTAAIEKSENIIEQQRQWIEETLGIGSSDEDTVKKELTGSTAGEETTIIGAINSLDTKIGSDTDMVNTYNGVETSNTIKANINAVNTAIGDLEEVGNNLDSNGKTITGNLAAPGSSVVDNLNALDARLGQIDGLANAIVENGGTYYGNLAGGSTVSDHLVELDAAIGNLQQTGVRGENIAAQLQTLGNDLQNLENEVRGGFAASAALSALVPNARATNDTQISLGTGMYRDRAGFAIGAFHYVNDNILLNAGAAYGGSKSTTLKAGITFGW